MTVAALRASGTEEAFLWVGACLLGIYAVTLLVFDRCLSSRGSYRTLLAELDGLEHEAARLQAVVSSAPNETVISQVNAAIAPTRGRIDRAVHAKGSVISTSKVLGLWRELHRLERTLYPVAPSAEVAARLVALQGQLSQLTNDAEAKALITRIRELDQDDDLTDEAERAQRSALLREALRVFHDRRDSRYERLADNTSQATWLAMLGLLVITVLAVAVGRESLLLFGALGGLLSRLARFLRRSRSGTDYGASSGTILLAPVAGALAGLAGVALVQGLASIEILNKTHFEDVWSDPDQVLSLGLAFAFGFVERLLEKVVRSTAQTLSVPAGGTPAADPAAAPAPDA